MVIPPPPPSYPPPETDEESDETTDSEAEPGELEVDMETPLMAHGMHKMTSGQKGVFRPLPTCYSSIEDVGQNNKSLDSTVDDEEDLSLSVRSIQTVSTAVENFRGNLILPFTSDDTSLPKIGAGLGSLAVVGVVLGLIMPKNPALNGRWYPWYRHISSVIGYTYFVLWSVCFYPQVLLNFRRKSTRGLSNDFALLNFLGWLFYSAYLASMFFDKEIQDLYEERFKNESSTVQSNDVLFSIHAMTLSFIYLVQIVYYGERGCCSSLRLKPQTWVLVIGMVGPALVVPILIKTGVLGFDYWLDYFYVLSFFKIMCTLTKYSKQVVLNCKRKSTSGWNIWYNFLECCGGTLSMLQIVFDSMDMQDMTGITGNMAKFALGLATIFFDAIFFTQHYILFPPPPPAEDEAPVPSTIKGNNTLVLTSTEDTDSDSYVSYEQNL